MEEDNVYKAEEKKVNDSLKIVNETIISGADNELKS